MATFNQKDFQKLFVGGTATKTTGKISAMNSGEIGIFTPAGARVTEATAATVEKFIIVKKRGTTETPLVSGIISKTSILNAIRKSYTAAVDQVTTVGYNGTSGSITASNNTAYHLRINLRQGLTSNHGGLYLKHAFYNSDSSATEYEIASNLYKGVVNEFSREADKVVKATMLCNNAGTATTGTVSVVTGSKYCTTTVPADFEIGGLLRLGTATTSSVYKILNIVGTVITLDTPVQETSATYAIAAAEFISASDATAASYGIKLTAVPGVYRVGKLENDLQAELFDVTLAGFGVTPVTTVAGYTGSGTEKQVKSMEWFLQGNEGDFMRKGEPNIFEQRAEASGNYHLIDLQVQELYNDSMVTNPINKVYTLAIPSPAPNYAISGTADDITDVLEVLVFGAANGNLAVV